jgi:hypothetical protein
MTISIRRSGWADQLPSCEVRPPHDVITPPDPASMQFRHRFRERCVCAAYLIDALPAYTEHGRDLEDPY